MCVCLLHGSLHRSVQRSALLLLALAQLVCSAFPSSQADSSFPKEEGEKDDREIKRFGRRKGGRPYVFALNFVGFGGGRVKPKLYLFQQPSTQLWQLWSPQQKTKQSLIVAQLHQASNLVDGSCSTVPGQQVVASMAGRGRSHSSLGFQHDAPGGREKSMPEKGERSFWKVRAVCLSLCACMRVCV
jgi:hypothetical protein